MFRSKRDVDKHVADLDEKIPSEKERSLKYFTVARLYFNIGEEGLALKYLDKYCNVRPSSAQAFKFRGQVLEKASERESEDEGLYSKKTAAVEAYKASYHLDLSQKELLKKICEITVQLPIHDTEHARYYITLHSFKPLNELTKKEKKKKTLKLLFVITVFISCLTNRI